MSKPEKEDATFFVSRRGHQVGLSQVDLKGIDIESDETAAQPSTRAKDPTPPKTSAAKVQRTKQPNTRKKVIIFAIIILLVSLPLILGEIVSAQYRGGITSAKRDLSTLVTKTVLPTQKKSSIAADGVGKVAHDVDDIVGRMCRGGLLDNMASLYPRADASLKACKSKQSQYAALSSSLFELEKQTKYLEDVGVLMKPVATPITDAYAVIGAQQAAWQTARDGLEKLTPPTSMNSAHVELVKHVVAVSDQWSRLNTANNSQDGTGFTDAEKALATEYEAVRTTSSTFAEVLSRTQQTITTAYNTLR